MADYIALTKVARYAAPSAPSLPATTSSRARS
jgi:hypothetical protein